MQVCLKSDAAPLVSVIVPTHNAAPYVVEAVESALKQAYPNKEIIVVDDGSTDNTRDVLGSYLDKIVYLSQENRGVSSARNTAIQHASGEFIAFLDADDIWLPGKLQVQVQFMVDHPEVGLVFAANERIDVTGKIISSYRGEKIITHYLKGGDEIFKNAVGLLQEHNIIPTSTVVLRRTCLEEVGGFDESLRSVEDRDLWFRMARRFRVGFVPTVLSRKRVHDSNISSDRLLALQSLIRVVEKMVDCQSESEGGSLGTLHTKLARLYFSLGYYYFVRGNHQQARKHFITSLSERVEGRSAMYFLATFAGRRLVAQAREFKREARKYERRRHGNRLGTRRLLILRWAGDGYRLSEILRARAREMIWSILQRARLVRAFMLLPAEAKAEHWKDLLRRGGEDPGVERAIEEPVAWLCRAQDNSVSKDGGVARHYSLIEGWGTSYPETTGYIVPTMLAYAQWRGDEEVRKRARRMLDWLVSIQLSEGGFQAGAIDSEPMVPCTFNTGQILLGLAAGVREFGDAYRDAMCRAADWLVKTQDPDGCWRKHPTPFAAPGEKTYETHVAWGLLEAARVEQNGTYVDAALANVHWALRHQRENGWFDNCCLTDPCQALTHTIGYALRGIIESYRFTKDPGVLHACRKTADGLLTAIQEDGFLPGRLHPNWRGAVTWACLTGTAQIAICWLLLWQFTGEVAYRKAGYAANRYLRHTIKIDGLPETRGGIKGSFPVYGKYCTYQYVNWASKFFVDSNMLEHFILQESIS